MERPVVLTDLPSELLIKILQQDQVTGLDLLSVHQTCNRLQKIAATHSLWAPKLRNKWPNWKNYRCPDSNWFNECQNMIDIFELCREKIIKISLEISQNESVDPLRHFSEIIDMYNGSGKNYMMMFLRDFSTRKINSDILESGFYDSTNQCTALFLLDYFNQFFLKNKWLEMIQNPHMLTPEKTALFFTQWIQPEYDEYDLCFDAAISDTIETVKSSLSRDHPFHKIKPEELEKWKNELYFKNTYNSESSREIIKNALDVLYNQRLLSSSQPSLSSMFIQDVMENKNSNCYYSLIILGAILRRCGVHVEMNYCQNYNSFSWQEVWGKISPLYDINLLNGEVNYVASSYYILSGPGPNCTIANGFLLLMASRILKFEDGSKIKRAQDLIKFIKPLNANSKYGFLLYGNW